MEKAELIFIPWPTMGHLAQLVELAKLIINGEGGGGRRKQQCSITLLIMKLPDFIDADGGSIIDSLVDSSTIPGQLHFFYLPPVDPDPEWSSRTRGYFVNKLIESHKPNVKHLIDNFHVLRGGGNSTKKVTGFVVDMLCTTMIDVADEFEVPSYVFFTSSAGFLSLMLHFQNLQDEHNQDISEFSSPNSSYPIPGFANPIPSSVLPLCLVEKQSWLGRFLHYARGYRKAKGIILNSFIDLEPYAFNSINKPENTYGTQNFPQIYPIGPILNRGQHSSYDNNNVKSKSEVLKWLEQKQSKSVIYVCFGSQGSLNEDQVKELAHGLERSGYNFLWSLRRPSPNNIRAVFPSEYGNYKDILPEGFLERTSRIGKVVGWAPQLEVLSKESIGGFISHCGWNSVLESIWCGIPMATWPLHSEQQVNAFQLVRELGLAVDVTLDYQERSPEQGLITAEAIEKGIRKVMESDGEVIRKNIKEMKEKSRISMMQGGSSYKRLGDLVDNFLLAA